MAGACMVGGMHSRVVCVAGGMHAGEIVTEVGSTHTTGMHFSEFSKISDRKYLSLRRIKLATSCVRDWNVTTAAARHM